MMRHNKRKRINTLQESDECTINSHLRDEKPKYLFVIGRVYT